MQKSSIGKSAIMQKNYSKLMATMPEILFA